MHFASARLVEPAVRSNLIIALGDLAFRFPNLLEPWTERIYGPLSDPDTGDPSPAPVQAAIFQDTLFIYSI